MEKLFSTFLYITNQIYIYALFLLRFSWSIRVENKCIAATRSCTYRQHLLTDASRGTLRGFITAKCQS